VFLTRLLRGSLILLITSLSGYFQINQTTSSSGFLEKKNNQRNRQFFNEKIYKFKINFPFMKNTWKRTLRFYRQVVYNQFFGILRTVVVRQTGSLVCENRGYVSNPVLWSLRTLVVVDVVYPTGSLLVENPG
jgi:hypothetical protein